MIAAALKVLAWVAAGALVLGLLTLLGLFLFIAYELWRVRQ